jgi:riboflavin transporter FmnP
LDAKSLALITVFVAVTLALNLAGPKIPAPYAPFLIYQLWEIPIVVAFLALGLIAGLITATINMLILMVYFPGPLQLGPVYNLIAVLAMMLGVYIPYIVATNGLKTENLGSFLRQHIKMISISATIMGITLRVAITTATNYIFVQQSPPVGFSYKPAAALAFLPLSALFNATVALYTIPTAFAVAIVAISVTSRYKI